MKNRFLSMLHTLRAGTRKRFRSRASCPPGVPCGGATHQPRLRDRAAGFSFRCDGCGGEFTPTPNSFILNHPLRIAEPDADEPTSVDDHSPLSRAALEALSEFELAERGLTEEGRQTLLQGQPVFMTADAFCASCLRQLFS